MARFSEYIDTEYLPGEVYSSGLGAYSQDPQGKTSYIAGKRFKFKPEKDDGTYFQQFLALQNNPQLLGQQAFGSSPGFFNTMSMFGGQ
jgi:hypothetical protein